MFSRPLETNLFRTGLVAIAVGALSVTAASQPFKRGGNDDPADQPVITPAESMVLDAAIYAAQHDVEYGEAMRRMTIMSSDLSDVETLRSDMGLDFTGVHFDNVSTDFRLVMRGRGVAPEALTLDLVPVFDRSTERAKYSRDDARGRAEERQRRAVQRRLMREARKAVRRNTARGERPIRIPRNAFDIADEMLAAPQVLNIEFVGDQTLSESEITSLITSRRSALDALIPDITGIGYNPVTDTVDILAVGEGEPSQELVDEASQSFGYKIALDYVEAPVRQEVLRGGGSLFTGSVGSLESGTCMSGFAVEYRNTSGLTQDGMLTAAHCMIEDPAHIAYSDPFNAFERIDLAFDATQSFIYGSSGDLAIVTGSSGQSDATFIGDDSGAVRGVFGSRTAANTNVRTATYAGSQICHYSWRTGQTCGSVSYVNYAPDFQPEPLEAGEVPDGPCGTYSPFGLCDPVFAVVEGPYLQSDFGDSGGPWFANNTVFGTHVGGTDRENEETGQNIAYSVYMPVESFSRIGATLKEFTF